MKTRTTRVSLPRVPRVPKKNTKPDIGVLGGLIAKMYLERKMRKGFHRSAQLKAREQICTILFAERGRSAAEVDEAPDASNFTLKRPLSTVFALTVLGMSNGHKHRNQIVRGRCRGGLFR